MKLPRVAVAVLVAAATLSCEALIGADFGYTTPRDDGGIEDVVARSDAGDAATTDGPRVQGVDLVHGDWKWRLVASTPDDSDAPSLESLADGLLVAAWIDRPLSGADTIWTARMQVSATAWSDAKPLDVDGLTSTWFPSLGQTGSGIGLTWSAVESVDRDLFLRRLDAASWGDRINLTGTFKSSERRSESTSTIAKRPNGEAVVGYISRAAGSGDPEVRVLRLRADGTPLGPPVAVFGPPESTSCDEVAIAADGAGYVHVAANCEPKGTSGLWYANDISGTFSPQFLFGGVHPVAMPAFADAGDGRGLYIAWVDRGPCRDTPANLCGDIYTAKLEDGIPKGVLRVTQTPDKDEDTVRIVVDRTGRPIVSFVERNAVKAYVTWLVDDSTWAPARTLDLDPATNDLATSGFALHPTTGLPSFLTSSRVGRNGHRDIRHVYFQPSGS